MHNSYKPKKNRKLDELSTVNNKRVKHVIRTVFPEQHSKE